MIEVEVFDARGRQPFVGEDVDGELDVHGSLERVAVELSIALGGVRVAKVEQRSWIGDRGDRRWRLP